MSAFLTSTPWLPLTSLLALTLLAWPLRGATRIALCPICIGVSGTWLWMLAARQAGFAVDASLLAIFLGASVVGGAQWVATRMPPTRSTLLWKTLALPLGFTAAYALVAQWWTGAAIAALVLAWVAAAFVRTPAGATGDAEAIVQLEEKMKNCC
jgi:hypothetical protein